MKKNEVRIICPCCKKHTLMKKDKNARIISGSVTVSTKCERCGGYVAITFKEKGFRTERISA